MNYRRMCHGPIKLFQKFASLHTIIDVTTVIYYRAGHPYPVLECIDPSFDDPELGDILFPDGEFGCVEWWQLSSVDKYEFAMRYMTDDMFACIVDEYLCRGYRGLGVFITENVW